MKQLTSKTSIILASAAVAIAVIGAVGYSAASFASEDSDTALNGNNGRGFFERHFADLTDEEKADMEARRADMENMQATVKDALDSADYEAWVAALPENCPMLETVNQNNFPKLVEAYNNMESARSILDELGVKGGFGMGMEMGKGGHGKMGGRGMGQGAWQNQDN